MAQKHRNPWKFQGFRQCKDYKDRVNIILDSWIGCPKGALPRANEKPPAPFGAAGGNIRANRVVG
jgi:hypothetical protein